MISRLLFRILLAAPMAAATLPASARAQTEAVRVVVNADLGRDTISRHIYGHFAEHLGRGIYDGIWRKNSGGEWQIRDDVVAALRAIKIPNLRWPGGCFADRYHWRDGVGPKAKRPSIVNTLWGDVTEDNHVGTHEFIDLVQRLGTEPFIVGNVGSGTVQEMADWWEYLNFGGRSPMADLRKQNGHEAPWKVRYFGVGNESWGCGGNMTPEYYANEYRRYATFLHPHGGVLPFRVATGPNAEDYRWTEVMLRKAGRFIDGLDLHYYTVVNNWEKKGSATEFTEREWIIALQKAMRVDEVITRHSAVMDQYDPGKRIALIVGEWGMWHDSEPGTKPGFLYQQNTMRDALVASVSLDIFNRHADRVRMANIAQTVNVLQAMILTSGDTMILTPTYHVFEMYTVHHDAVLLPSVVSGGQYQYDNVSVPAVCVSASRDRSGRIHVTMSNLDPTKARAVEMDVRGARVANVSGRILRGHAMNSRHTFGKPTAVRPATFTGARVDGDRVWVELPSRAVVVLELW